MAKTDYVISFLRIFAALAVIFLHTCSTLLLNPDIFSFSSGQEIFLRIGYYLFMWAVPVFFMITGSLLLSLEKLLDYKTIFKKYVLRIFLALLIFGIPFAAVKVYLEQHTFSLPLIVKAFIGNQSFAHLWYLYALIGIYLIMPVLKPAVKSADFKTLTIFCACILVMEFLFPVISDISGVNIAFGMPVGYSVFYILAGYLIRSRRNLLKTGVCAAIALVCALSVAVLVCSGRWKAIADSYFSPLVALYSVSVYSLVISLGDIRLSERQAKLIWKLDRLCFGVYLIHPVFIQFSYRILKITPLSFEMYPLAAVIFFVIFSVLAFAASFVMSLVPPLRKYVI